MAIGSYSVTVDSVLAEGGFAMVYLVNAKLANAKSTKAALKVRIIKNIQIYIYKYKHLNINIIKPRQKHPASKKLLGVIVGLPCTFASHKISTCYYVSHRYRYI